MYLDGNRLDDLTCFPALPGPARARAIYACALACSMRRRVSWGDAGRAGPVTSLSHSVTSVTRPGQGCRPSGVKNLSFGAGTVPYPYAVFDLSCTSAACTCHTVMYLPVRYRTGTVCSGVQHFIQHVQVPISATVRVVRVVRVIRFCSSKSCTRKWYELYEVHQRRTLVRSPPGTVQ